MPHEIFKKSYSKLIASCLTAHGSYFGVGHDTLCVKVKGLVWPFWK